MRPRKGPQTITVRGRRAAVVLSAQEYDRLKHPPSSLTEFLRASPLAGTELGRRTRPVSIARRGSVSFLVDTCVLSELVKPQPSPRVSEWFKAAPPQTLFISVLTLGEIRKGIEKLPQSRRRRKDRRVAQYGVAGLVRGPCPVGRCGRRRRMGPPMARRGSLPAIDSLIAATALQHRLAVVTRNEGRLRRRGRRAAESLEGRPSFPVGWVRRIVRRAQGQARPARCGRASMTLAVKTSAPLGIVAHEVAEELRPRARRGGPPRRAPLQS